MFNSSLDFHGKNSIELLNENTVVDKIGSSDQNIEDIDVSQLQNLSIQRSRLLKQGNPVFISDNFFEEWKVSPNSDLDDLGFHVNACHSSVLFWENVSALEPEYDVNEFQLTPIINDLKSTSKLSDKCKIFMTFIGAEYQPIDPLATYGVDYSSDIKDNQEFILNKGFESRNYEIATIIDDVDPPEGDEGFGLIFDIVQGQCPANATVDLTRDILDIRILDNETLSNKNLIDEKSISVAPTIVEKSFIIRSDKHIISTINILDSRGAIIKTNSELNSLNLNLDASNLQVTGILYIHVITSEGDVLKKIFKI